MSLTNKETISSKLDIEVDVLIPDDIVSSSTFIVNTMSNHTIPGFSF